MDTAAASSIRRGETVLIALLLAFAGGYIDTYTWIMHGVMANAQTANLVLPWVYGSIGNWTKALHFVPPILALAAGILVAAWLRRATGARASAIGTLIEILLLITIAILHNGLPELAGTLGISFVAAVQSAVFTRGEGVLYSSVMITGNMRQAIEGLFAAASGAGALRPPAFSPPCASPSVSGRLWPLSRRSKSRIWRSVSPWSHCWSCCCSAKSQARRAGSDVFWAEMELDRPVSAYKLVGAVSQRLDAFGRHRRHHARGLRHSGVAGLCHPGGPAAPDRHLRLHARRHRLCAAGVVPPACDRSDLRDLADDCGDRRDAGRRRPGEIRRDRELGRMRSGAALSDRMVVQAQRSRPSGERQYSGRFQGRRRTHHHDEPVAEPVRRHRRRSQFFDRAVKLAAQLGDINWLVLAIGAIALLSLLGESGVCRDGRSDSRSWRCRSSWRRCLGFRRAACRSPAKFPTDCRRSDYRAWVYWSRTNFSRWPRMRAAGLHRRCLCRPQLCCQAWLCP